MKICNVKGYEGLYIITSSGLVFGIKRGKSRATDITKLGYLRVRLCKNGVYGRYYIHRLVAEHFIVNPENKPEVNHKDKDRKNNNDWNLAWSTRKENIYHRDNYVPDQAPEEEDNLPF